MKKRANEYISNPEALEQAIKDIVHTIHHDEDPHEMNAYKRFFKKHVSVFSRAYFTAYLVKQIAPAESDSRRRQPDSTKAMLFVSVGKNRKVFPRDLIALFADNDRIDPASIGQIKILDNYSFVEVEPEIADTIIELFNGQEFRGRKLTVNHARKKS